jgi:Zinc finger, C3HC4 type (RING finger)
MISDARFNSVVVFPSDKGISVYDYEKKGTVATFLYPVPKRDLNGSYVTATPTRTKTRCYTIFGSSVIFRYQYIFFGTDHFCICCYNLANEKFYSANAEDEYFTQMYRQGDNLIFGGNEYPTIGNQNQYFKPIRKVFITKDLQNFIKIENDRNLLCSCHIKDNILVLVNPEKPSDGLYHDIKRNTVIDVGNFIGWLPDSLSYMEYSAEMKMSILKRFSKEPVSDRDHCVVCFEDLETKYAIIPCGHTQVCGGCIDKLDTCLLCKTKFTAKLRIF